MTKELIAANELRIGNLYNDNGVFKKASPSTIEEVWNAPRSWCKAIPLTEEILLINCRFKKSPHDIRFKTLNSIRLKTTEKGFKFNYGESIMYIKYVHQLQNLYFALTGKELTIKHQEQ